MPSVGLGLIDSIRAARCARTSGLETGPLSACRPQWDAEIDSPPAGGRSALHRPAPQKLPFRAAPSVRFCPVPRRHWPATRQHNLRWEIERFW